MEQITELFGSKVFNDAIMKARLPKETYKQVKKAKAPPCRALRALREKLFRFRQTTANPCSVQPCACA